MNKGNEVSHRPPQCCCDTVIMPEARRASATLASVGLTKSTPLVMTVRELSGALGISLGGMYDAIKRHEVPGVIVIGRRIVISRRAVEAWINGGVGNE